MSLMIVNTNKQKYFRKYIFSRITNDVCCETTLFSLFFACAKDLHAIAFAVLGALLYGQNYILIGLIFVALFRANGQICFVFPVKITFRYLYLYHVKYY